MSQQKKYKWAGANEVEVDKWAKEEKVKIAVDTFSKVVQQITSFALALTERARLSFSDRTT